MNKNRLTALLIGSFALLFSGCLYPNECGISYNYYDKMGTHYDSQGNFIERCPDGNLVDYEDAIKLYDEIYEGAVKIYEEEFE